MHKISLNKGFSCLLVVGFIFSIATKTFAQTTPGNGTGAQGNAVPTTPTAEKYTDNFVKQIQDKFDGTNTGCSHGPFKIYCMSDGGGLDPHDDANTNFVINGERGSGWWDGFESVMKAGTAIGQELSSAEMLAFGAFISIFTSLILIWAGKEVWAASIMYRAFLIAFLLPTYTWVFIRFQNSVINLNNFLYDKITDKAFNSSNLDWVQQAEKAAFNIIDVFPASIFNMPLYTVTIVMHKLYGISLNFFVFIIYIWGILAIYMTIFGFLGSSIFRGWSKSAIGVYATYIMWNLVASFGVVCREANIAMDTPLWYGLEAAYVLVPVITTAILYGGNIAGAAVSLSQGIVNNAGSALQTGAGIAGGASGGGGFGGGSSGSGRTGGGPSGPSSVGGGTQPPQDSGGGSGLGVGGMAYAAASGLARGGAAAFQAQGGGNMGRSLLPGRGYQTGY